MSSGSPRRRRMCGCVSMAALAGSVILGMAIATPAFPDESCPNEALRSELHSGQLPDCRAYELVSPSYKEASVIAQNHVFIAPDGSHLIADALGVFAGAENNEAGYGTWYEFSRTGSGWSSTSLDPPSSQLLGTNTERQEYGLADGLLWGASTDLTKTLWGLRKPSQSADAEVFYLREPPSPEGSSCPSGSVTVPGACFVAVGPVQSPTAEVGQRTPYVGASEDLTHVFYEIFGTTAAKWPFDKSLESPSLYAYSGTGQQEPVLVGVSGGSGDTNLISQCGTELGSGNGHSAYNAISEDGSRVFFTPMGKDAVSCGGTQPLLQELFAREEGAGGSQMRTVSVSEPSPNEECTTEACKQAPAADANFEGASKDGSKVFFTSTQQLTDGAAEDSAGEDSAYQGCSATTGPGGCELYEYDFANPLGHKLVLVSAGDPGGAQVQGVARISADGSHVYFVAKGVLASNTGPAADPASKLPEHAEEGAENLYVFERDEQTVREGFPHGRTVFIARLSTEDAGVWEREDERMVQVSSDGRFLVFPSFAHLTPDDTSSESLWQIFEYDSRTGVLGRASAGQKSVLYPEGYNNDGNIEEEKEGLPILAGYARSDNYGAYEDFPTEGVSSTGVTDSGTVLFTSTDPLTPQVASGRVGLYSNIYEYRAGNVYLVSDGQDLSVSQFLGDGPGLFGVTPVGGDVFFATQEQLVPQDTDTQGDIYDARVNGGFSAPVSPPDCEGEACQGSATAPPPLFTAGSATQIGGENINRPASRPAPKPKPKPLTRAQKLAKALKGCRAKRGRRRRTCEVQARRKYQGKLKSVTHNRQAVRKASTKAGRS
jgi:hypothetical protein